MDTSQRGVAAILFDLGDTIMQEETEQKDAAGVTHKAELVAGAIETLRTLKSRGYRLGLVADTRVGTYQNVLNQHGIFNLFNSFAISEELGCVKPDGAMFAKALSDMGLTAGDRHRIIMVGNNLARDIAGANRAGFLSVWTHWNDRYSTNPANDDEVPDYRINKLGELLELVDQIETELQLGGGAFNADLARRFAPCMQFDSREPFLPVVVGCTVFDRPCPSPSFPRIFRPRAGGKVIEYAVYWDWDIGHHYELEHIWAHISADDQLTCLEASWHGGYHRMWPEPDDQPQREVAPAHYTASASSPGTPPVVYSQPGKHAFAPDPSWFTTLKDRSAACLERAGSAGLLVTPLYRGILVKTAEKDALARAYLQKHAFIPSFLFNKSLRLSEVSMVPWRSLDEFIPKRIDAWMTALSAGHDAPGEAILPA